MRSKWLNGLLLVGLTIVCSSAPAQTDVALSLYGAFHGTTNGNGTVQSPANSAGVTCTSIAPVAVSANAHEIAGNWIVSVHVANLRPFALAGVGALFHQPTSGQTNTTSDTKAVFIYGAGLDWGLVGPLGLRFQYRGNLYKAPDLTKLYTSTNAFTHTAQPMIGAYFRF